MKNRNDLIKEWMQIANDDLVVANQLPISEDDAKEAYNLAEAIKNYIQSKIIL